MKCFIIFLVAVGFVGSVFATSDVPQTQSLNSSDALKSDSLFKIKLNQTVKFDSLKLKFSEIEDSRCPSDVTCVWEGQAIIILQINDTKQDQTITFTTDEDVVAHVGPYEINLVNIAPYPISMKDISDEYVVTIGISKNSEESIVAPLKQINTGVTLMDVKCSEGKQLTYKYNKLRVACVYETILEKLFERGWALPKNQQDELMTSLSGNTYDEYKTNNLRINITPKIINDKNYLIFEGSGWNYLQDIDITIYKNVEKITSIRTKTNHNGIFYLSWPVPSDFQNNQYNVRVTDGKKQTETSMTILGLSNKVNQIDSGFEVKVDGEKQVRRGTTHNIVVQVYQDKIPVDGARVFLTIEDYGENIIREFKGHTNQEGYFVYSWEIPKNFDDIETLLAFVGVTDGNSSRTEIFKFQVYCLPGEKECKVDGN